jgi:hypothetical protein
MPPLTRMCLRVSRGNAGFVIPSNNRGLVKCDNPAPARANPTTAAVREFSFAPLEANCGPL